MRHDTYTAILRDLNLPQNLLRLIASGQLHDAIDRAERQMAVMNDALDAWEAANPEAAAIAPWADSRKAWKEAGRPSPPWYELLWACQERAVDSREMHQLIPEFARKHWQNIKDDPEKRKAYNRKRARPRYAARLKREARAKEQAESTV